MQPVFLCFFACWLFLWMPHRILQMHLTFPQHLCTSTMIKAGLYRTHPEGPEGGHRASLGSCPQLTAANFQLYLRNTAEVHNLGNSASRLCNTLREAHRRCTSPCASSCWPCAQ
ncbi:hypothetical protein PFLUV_G00210290 [Perca fluviatilis]|uniref:DUF6729 domain-containing protein n=1 Tax=Perca fluviatilis TaxID=8168 RepID=A0A6A5DSK0_PERFL|nr:hypothetical protein PFLUV_G00210290 [Perca fluviatilis]